jgi:hypothetical protein
MVRGWSIWSASIQLVLVTNNLEQVQLVVAFENKDLRMVCENESIAKENYGSTKLQDRLADIFAATTVRDLPVGNPVETEYETLPAFKIEIEAGLLLFISPNHVAIPCLQDGHVAWDKVSRVKIIAIQKNRHGKLYRISTKLGFGSRKYNQRSSCK